MDSGTDQPIEMSSHPPCSLWEPNFVHVDHFKGTGCNPSLGSMTGSRESSRVEESVESQAAVKDCPVFPERTKSWE